MSDTTIFSVPIDALLVLVGPAGSGKTSFAEKHFDPTQTVSSDQCRAFVSDDPTRLEVSREAFDVMMNIMRHRLRLGKTTVADSTALNPQIRRQFIKLAKKHRRPVIAVLFDVSRDRCLENNESRDREVPEKAIYNHHERFQEQKERIQEEESFDEVFVVDEETVDDVIVRMRNVNVQQDYDGALDIIGDVHGCLDELTSLLEKLGYERTEDGYAHPEKRKAVFLGDIANRGPNSLGTLALVMDMVSGGNAFYTPGNHCNILYQYFLDQYEKSDLSTEGVETTIEELEDLSEEERAEFRERFKNLYEMSPPYLVFHDGELVVTHAGIRERDIGKVNEEIAQFCLRGDTLEETTDQGYPIRRPWPLSYNGDSLVVYGHSPVEKATFVNGTINIDQGAVYGGYLTALQFPERELMHVKAQEDYSDHQYDSVQELVENRSDPYYHLDLLKGDFDCEKDGENIHVNENTIKRGLDRVTAAEVPLQSLLYLPSEPARAIPSSPIDKQITESCSEILDHYQSQGIQEIRTLREDHGMIPAVMVACRNSSDAEQLFGHQQSTFLYDKKGQVLSGESEFLSEIRDDLFDEPWISDQERCFIVEGLWATDGDPLKDELHWISNDRKELTEVVKRLRDASPDVGAVKTVLKDLEVVHSELGRNLEHLTRKLNTEQEQEEESPELFIPLRYIATNQQILLGTVREIPSGQKIWGQKEGFGNPVSTLPVDDEDRFISMWSGRPEVNAWWGLPKYTEEAKWNPEMIPSFRVVGKKRWKLSELVSPRRWWGRETSAKWAGWNSSREIFALGHEGARRFVEKLHPSFMLQSLTAQAGLSHW